MQNFRKVIEYLWPEVLLAGTQWYNDWRTDHLRHFANRCKIFFSLTAAAYVLHYYLVDVPNNKEPIEAWFLFRMAMATICALCVIFYSVPRWSDSRWAKLPAIVAMIAGCYTQAHVAVYFPEAPWIYPYIFVFSSVLVLATTPLKSLAFATPLMISFVNPLEQAGVPFYQLASATAVCAIVIFVVRTSSISDIRNFVLTQERDESRREIIKLGKEYEGRLRSFIPRVIYERLEYLVDEKKMSILEATVEVLRPRKQTVACLWSDIRGFTQDSENIDDFLSESVVPEVKACSDAVETHRGIPRKIGDLIFAYFDEANEHLNLARAVQAGIRISELNADLNATFSTIQVKRYILISTGEALIGNVGGLNSGVEITALGPPVNFLARLDEATKDPALSKHLSAGDIIMCPNSASALVPLGFCSEIKRIDIRAEGIEIRDFPDVKDVFVLHPTQRLNDIIQHIAANSST